MPEQESDPGFTFVDRRRRAEEQAPPHETPPPLPGPPPTPSLGDLAGAVGGPPGADLASLFVMLYSNALMALGQVPDPGTGQPHPDLDQARFTIDLLALLKEKTEGNRTPEESAMLDEILSTLRMSFVRATRLS